MSLTTISQVYLLPATSDYLNRACACLNALNLTYELLPDATGSREALFKLVVEVPFIPVVHLFEFDTMRSEILTQARELVSCPSHVQVRGWVSGEELPLAYPPAFFAQTAEQALVLASAELLVRSRIIKHFPNQLIRKITFNKPLAESLGVARLFPGQEAYAFVEEARLLLPDLAELLGAATHQPD
jgi:hypothetical protein